MSAGTITVTNGSATVTGNGTSFTTELKSGDFIGVIAGGTPYTLIVASVASNTQLTIGAAYTGPTASGLAWYAVPASLMYAVTQQAMNDMGTALRGMNSQMVNWQKIYSDASSVTVERPDRTSFTGPSWGYMAQQYASKANSADVLAKADNLGGLTDKAAARTNLGLKGAAVLDVGTALGTVAAGNDSRFNTVNNKSGGTISSDTTVSGSVSANNLIATSGGLRVSGVSAIPANSNTMNWTGGTLDLVNNPGSNTGAAKITLRMVNTDNSANLAVFTLQNNGVGLASGGWQTGSDERIKEDIKDIDPATALEAVLKLRHVTFKMRDRPDGNGGWLKGERSAGYLAQDLEKYLPEAVSSASTPKTFDENGNQTGFPYQCKADDGSTLEIEDMKSVDPGKAAAALNGAAIKALNGIIEKQNAIIDELSKRMKAIDGLDA